MGTEADGTRGAAQPATAFLPAALHAVLANEVRHEILMRCGDRPWSATELAEAMDLERRQVTDQIEELKKTKPPLIEMVGKKRSAKGKGGAMRMYRATRYALDADQWASLPPLAQEVSSSNIVGLITEELARALRDQTLHTRKDHVLYRERHMVDEEGMRKICAILTRAADDVAAEASASVDRMSISNESPIPLTFGLLSFEVASEHAERTPKNLGS